MKKIAVVGGGGFIGKYLCMDLLRQGYSVVAFDNFERDQNNVIEFELFTNRQVQVRDLDVTDFYQLLKKMHGFDEIYFLAAINGTANFYSRPFRVLQVGAVGGINICQVAKTLEIPELWLFSTSEVYGQPSQIPTPENIEFLKLDPNNFRHSYAAGKIVTEMAANFISNKSTNIRIIRPHNIYGSKMGDKHVIPELVTRINNLKLEHGKTLEIQGSGFETRAFCHIFDFLDAIRLIKKINKNYEVFNIGTTEEVNIFHLVEMICAALDINKNSLDIQHENLTKGSTTRRCPDISKIKELGFEPKISLKNGIEMYIEDEINV